MPYQGLVDYLESLEAQGELARIEVEVDPCGELWEISRRALADKLESTTPALLFSRVAGHEWPLVVNLFGTQSRLTRALEADSCAELAERLADTAQSPAPAGMFERLKRLGSGGKSLPSNGPIVVKSARCQQVVELGRDIDLMALPLPRIGIEGERAAITAGQLFAREPGGSNVTVTGIPAIVLERNQLGLAWHRESELARYWSLARQRGEPLGVAIALGACPSWAIVGETPLPIGWHPYAYAAALRGAPIEIAKGGTQAVDVPAEAQIVLEGVIDTTAGFVALEPFLTPLGQMAPAGSGPRLELTAVTHRANPVLPARAACWPWHESAILRRASLRLLLPAAQQVAADLVALDAPLAGAGRIVFAALAKRYPGQVAQAAAALRGWPPTAAVPIVVFVDADIDIEDAAHVWGRVATECDLASDLFWSARPSHPFAAAQAMSPPGTEIAIDATRKLPGERPWSSTIEPAVSAEMLDRVERRWNEFGLAPVAKTSSRC